MKRRAINIVAVLMALLMLLGLAFAEGYDEELQLGAPEDAEVLEIEDGADAMDEAAVGLVDSDLLLGADDVIEQLVEEETVGEPVEEQSAEEQPAEEQPAEEQPAEEQPAEEETVEEENVEEEAADETAEEEVAEEQPEDATSTDRPVANVLTYNGEAQALVAAQGAWLYSLDGESYSEDIPTAVDAGEYTVYFKAVEETETAEDPEPAETEALTVTIAKADVTFTPPVAAYVED